MSLQVWLPLTGDLHNQGLNGSLNFTAINTLTFVDGKIGQCYQRATNDTQVTTGINIDSNLLDLLGTEASVAMWVKPLGTHTHYNGTLLSSGNWNAKRWAFGVSQDNTKVDVLCGGYNTYIDCIVPVDEWTHLCSTFDNGISKLYKNGVYIGQLTGRASFDSDATSTCIGRETYAGGYFGFNGLINDVRIYNHVLSDKEVEEIAKGLVLHYKLDNNGLGGKNLALNTKTLDVTSSKNNLNMYIRGASTRQLRSDGFYESKGTASWHGLSFWANQLNLTPGTKVTYSFYIYGNGSSRAFSFYPMMYNSAGTRDTSTKMPISIDGGSYTTVNSKSFENTTSTVPEYHYVTFEWNQAVADIINNGGSIELSIQVHGTWNDGDWACLFAPKVEIGDTPTPWSPNSLDLNIDSSIIYDSSGYGNDGILNSNLIINTDTPKYFASSYFGDYETPKITLQDPSILTNLTNCTVCWWGKYDTTKTLLLRGQSGSVYLAASDNNTFYHGSSGSPIMYKNGINGTYKCVANSWDFYVLKNVDLSTWTTMKINGYSTGWPLKGLISDFRIYATALTDDQILELYHTSATIDNNGNVYAREVVE